MTLPQWSKIAHDNRNTGQSEYIASQDGTLKWIFSTETTNKILSSPIIDYDGTIYIGTGWGYASNKFFAINPNGSQKWVIDLSSYGTVGTPAISPDGTIYIPAQSGYLYAINPDGTLKWAYVLGSTNWGTSPAIAGDGTIYIGDRISGGRLKAINPDGTLKWQFPINIIDYSSPAIGSDGTIYMTSGNSTNPFMYAINPDGTEKWHFTFAGDIYSSPSIANDGTIYAVTYSGGSLGGGMLCAINADNTEKWNYSLTGSVWYSIPTIGTDGVIYIGTDSGDFYAINSNGTEKWHVLMPDTICSSAAIGADNKIYLHTFYDLYCLDPIDGSTVWSYTVDGTGDITSSPSIAADGTVYVGSSDYNVYAFRYIPPPCSLAPKYSGDTVTLNATPKAGIGPYYVEFRKNDIIIDPSRLEGLSNPILSAPEDTLITRVYTLNDLDISSALTGTIDFSVYMEDSCPTGAQTCEDVCTINIGCLAPVCNFQVT